MRPELSIASAFGRTFCVVQVYSVTKPVTGLIYPSLFAASSVNQTTPFGATAVAVGLLLGVGVLTVPTVTIAWAADAASAITLTAAPILKSRRVPILCILYLRAVSGAWEELVEVAGTSQKTSRPGT